MVYILFSKYESDLYLISNVLCIQGFMYLPGEFPLLTHLSHKMATGSVKNSTEDLIGNTQAIVVNSKSFLILILLIGQLPDLWGT